MSEITTADRVYNLMAEVHGLPAAELYRTIGSKLGITNKAAQEAVTKLRAAGWVTRTPGGLHRVTSRRVAGGEWATRQSGN